MNWRRGILCLLIAGLAAQGQEIDTELLVSGLNAPSEIRSARDGSGRLFVVEQSGTIRIIRNGQLLSQPFLEIQDRVVSGGERGLLGLAFPPGFSSSQRFYVDYTGPGGNTRISMFEVTGDPNVADASSETVLLTIDQPFSNHNGGQLQFGPGGYLFVATGDGGSAGDPADRAQSLDTLLGKLLRVDVESQPGTLKIPPGNPFVGTPGARGEIWAYGLRNPWRFAFDQGDLWIADVGQNRFEEVNRRSASSSGDNYGWRRMEGSQCYDAGCNSAGLILPLHVYSHSQGCSVTGGYVYRGGQIESLEGLYVYGDYCSGRIWSLSAQGQNAQLLDTTYAISTFGLDEDGTLYVADRGQGRIFRFIEKPAPPPPPIVSISAAVSAATFEPGLSGGALASLYVEGVRDDPGVSAASAIPLPLSLDGVSVTVDGAPAPIHGIANVNGIEQINVQVPWLLIGETAVTVVVSKDGVASDPFTASADRAQPGVFSIAPGQPAIVHVDDYSFVTEQNPLAPGEYATVYATGLGAVQNRPPTGEAATSAESTVIAAVTATLGGLPADVVFAGLAPSLVGVYQINLRTPENAPSGLSELVLETQGRSSPPAPLAVQEKAAAWSRPPQATDRSFRLLGVL